MAANGLGSAVSYHPFLISASSRFPSRLLLYPESEGSRVPSETSLTSYLTTRRRIPYASILHIVRSLSVLQ